MEQDRFVVSRRDKRLSEELQMDAELTLEKALNRACESELEKKQQEMLHANFKANITVTGPCLCEQECAPQTSKATKQIWCHKSHAVKKTQWTSCGDMKGHSMQQCPARKAACNHCRKKGLFARVCRKKRYVK